jgi:hypothetical protein
VNKVRNKLEHLYEELNANQLLENIRWEGDVLVRDKLKQLMSMQHEMAYNSPDYKSYQEVIHELKARLFYIENIMNTSIGTSAFVTLKPIRQYSTPQLIESTEEAIKLVNRDFFGRNCDGRLTGGVMIEIHSKTGGKPYAHAHCLLSSPDGFADQNAISELTNSFEKVRTARKKPITDSDKASLIKKTGNVRAGRLFALHYRIHDKYKRCMFPCLDVKPVYDLEICADYMTKSIMHPDVVGSDAKDGAGWYLIEYPSGVRGDKGNRPQLVRV